MHPQESDDAELLHSETRDTDQPKIDRHVSLMWLRPGLFDLRSNAELAQDILNLLDIRKDFCNTPDLDDVGIPAARRTCTSVEFIKNDGALIAPSRKRRRGAHSRFAVWLRWRFGKRWNSHC